MKFSAPAEQLCIRTPLIKLCTKIDYFDLFLQAFEDLMSKLMSYKDEVSDTEFKTILDETYLTSPKDMVLAVSIAKSYPDAIKTGQIEKMPIESPYVQSTYIDYHYHGFCTVISFTELLKSFKNLDSVEKDTSFFTVVWLKVIFHIKP